MNKFIKFSLFCVSGFIMGFLSPLIYFGIKNPKQLLNEIINN